MPYTRFADKSVAAGLRSWAREAREEADQKVARFKSGVPQDFLAWRGLYEEAVALDQGADDAEKLADDIDAGRRVF